MDIIFANNKLEKILSDPKEIQRVYGQLARKINQRLGELKSVDNLSIMRMLPAARCHELNGDRQGYLAVDISPNYRLIFEPEHDPKPVKADGGLDWKQVTAIKITEIEDYH